MKSRNSADSQKLLVASIRPYPHLFHGCFQCLEPGHIFNIRQRSQCSTVSRFNIIGIDRQVVDLLVVKFRHIQHRIHYIGIIIIHLIGFLLLFVQNTLQLRIKYRIGQQIIIDIHLLIDGFSHLL